MFGTTRLLRRVWQIYVAHILLFVVYLASVHFLSDRFNTPDFIDRFNVAPLLNAPVETLTQGLLLRYKPLNLDVLPLYVVLMGAFPPVLWLMLRHRNWVMLGSVLLYFAARQFGWNLPSYPSGVWYFNPFAWQLLFVLGAWLALGGANTLHFLVRSRTVLVARAGLSALCGRHDPVRRCYRSFRIVSARAVRSLQPERQDQSGALSLPASGHRDHPGRAVHTDRCAGTAGRHLEAADQMRPAIPRSVCVGIYLAFIGYFDPGRRLPTGSSRNCWSESAGIAIMTAVAYYRSWSKRVEKSVHAGAHHPPAGEPHLPVPELVQQDSRMTVGAV